MVDRGIGMVGLVAVVLDCPDGMMEAAIQDEDRGLIDDCVFYLMWTLQATPDGSVSDEHIMNLINILYSPLL